MGPGLTYRFLRAHSSRIDANFLKGAPSSSTIAFLITGLNLPDCREQCQKFFILSKEIKRCSTYYIQKI
uniref:MEE51 n=1 Tax=Arundo donax TaxID=35708 RepID=A0A0A9D0Q5_ARUDO